MEAIMSTLISRPRSANTLQTVIWSAKITFLVMVASATTLKLHSYILLLEFSPRALWLALNAIILAIWKLSTFSDDNNPDDQHQQEALADSSHEDDAGDADVVASRPSTTIMLSREQPRRHPAEPSTPLPVLTNEPAADRQMVISPGIIEVVGGVRNEESSMDATWDAIMARHRNSGGGMAATVAAGARASTSSSKPVDILLKKSETWDDMRQLMRAERRSSDQTTTAPSTSYGGGERRLVVRPMDVSKKGEEEEEVGVIGRMERAVLVAGEDEQLRRCADAFIRKQRANLRLQRQESELRRMHFDRVKLINTGYSCSV